MRPLVLNARAAREMGSRIHQVGLASISPHLARSRTRRCTLRSTCSLQLRPVLAPSLPRWPRVWQRRSRASVRGYRTGLKKTWSQLLREKGRDRKVIQLCGPDSSLGSVFSPFAVMGRKGIVKPTSKSRVYLPDVTGLTSAMESPARARLDYHRVNPADREMQSKCSSATSVCRPLIRPPRTYHKYLGYRAIKIDLPRIRAQYFPSPCPGTRIGAGTV